MGCAHSASATHATFSVALIEARSTFGEGQMTEIFSRANLESDRSGLQRYGPTGHIDHRQSLYSADRNLYCFN